jgi:hypothetical protein
VCHDYTSVFDLENKACRLRLPDILTYVQQRPITSAFIGINAIPVLEMAIRAIGNCIELSQSKDPEAWHELGGNAIGIIWLTPCAFDAFPGARLLGAVSFIFYSYFKGAEDKNNKPLLTSKKVVQFIALFYTGFALVRNNPIRASIVLASAYLLFRQIDLKTLSIFSKVWPKQ